MTVYGSFRFFVRKPVTVVRGLLLAASLIAPTAVFAQSADMSQLMNRLNRLETEMQTLNRQVYRGEGGSAGVLAGPSPTLAADFEVRLSRLEEELRVLTGRYEETQFQLSRVREQLDRLSGDIDFRLSQLEGGTSSGPAATVAPTPSGRESAASGAQDTAAVGGAATSGQADPAEASLPGGNPQAQYDYAYGLLRQADYPRAEQAFLNFVQQNPDHALASNAQYWLGETFYVRNKFTEAAVAFAEGYQKYPKSSKAPDSLLKLGMSLAQLDQGNDACLTFQQLDSEFPDAPASIKNRMQQERTRLNCS